MHQEERTEERHGIAKRIVNTIFGRLLRKHGDKPRLGAEERRQPPAPQAAASDQAPEDAPKPETHDAGAAGSSNDPARQAEHAEKQVLEAMAALSLAPSGAAPHGAHPGGKPGPSMAQPERPERPRLDASGGLEAVAEFIGSGHARNIVFAVGAGISVSAGIPDFRTPGTGLYSQLEKYGLPYPEAVFDISYFRNISAQPFYMLAKEMFMSDHKPTPTHHFMRLLHDKGVLLRVFTQNIDSLESRAGLPKDKIVAAHGNCDAAHCIECHAEAKMEDVQAAMAAGEPMKCTRCKWGLVKPDIVFYGEELPARFEECMKKDAPKCDLMIVMGTSLVVFPFASVVGSARPSVPRVLINREAVKDGAPGFFSFGKRDALHLGDCDAAVQQLARALGWEKELQKLISGGGAR